MNLLQLKAQNRLKNLKNKQVCHESGTLFLFFLQKSCIIRLKYLLLLTKCNQEEEKMEKIDFLDKKILSILSKNARIPFKDVAAECNVSRAAIHQRVQHLIDADVITGSGFDVNPKSLGYSTCTYVGINLERGSMYKEVVERLKHIPEVVECHFTTGPYTMLVKLYARDNEQLMELLNGKLQGTPGVVATETLISLEQSLKREIPIVLADEEKSL